MTNGRPSPEQSLQRVREEEQQRGQGKLKIYLGAAPGVGKTWEMLHDALEKRNKNLDVVIGVAESHGREDIELMSSHFERIPGKTIHYHNKTCVEFNLDAALQRQPGLILVDEMAHTNAPGLRHAKRWQDIRELLDRGIDVYTTLNVQHIESLKDDVAQIIQAPIKETVPDSMIERADTIELIDLPPEELLKRLQEGKIYFPEQAELAREHFFRKGNLTALRELALRATAERVETDVLWYRQGEGIKQIWPVRDKILVCVGPRPESLRLIRAAKRLANSLQAEWLAVHIDIPRPQAKIYERNLAIQNLRLAELLGAETHVLTGTDIVREILNFAHEQNVTQIMIWKHIITRWRGWFRRSLADEIVRHSGEINVYIVTGIASDPQPPSPPKKLSYAISWKTWGITLGVVILATLVNTLLFPLVTSATLLMIYLIGVTIVALLGRPKASLLAFILCVILYYPFFAPGFYVFDKSVVEDLFTLLVILLITQTISYLIIRIRRQAESARLTQHQTTALYNFSRKLTSTRGIDKLLALVIPHMADIFNSDIMVLLPEKEQLEIQFAWPSRKKLNAKEKSIAQWVYAMGQRAGFTTDTLSFSNALYLPLTGPAGSIGVLRIQSRSPELFTPEQGNLLESCTRQLASVLNVDRLHEKTKMKELEMETDRVQTALLTSIFRDLCFPLQRVISKVHQLKQKQETKAGSKDDNIDYEINKLNRLNNNLFRIIQLESQDLQLEKNPSSLKKIIDDVVKTTADNLEKRPIHLTLAENLPLINLDSKLVKEVIVHLLENAIKFSPAQSPIHIMVNINKEKAIVSIIDAGSGIVPDEKGKLFKKFYKGKRVIAAHGLGLGLAICQKIIAAHQGEIWVENIDKNGAAFRFSLPV